MDFKQLQKIGDSFTQSKSDGTGKRTSKDQIKDALKKTTSTSSAILTAKKAIADGASSDLVIEAIIETLGDVIDQLEAKLSAAPVEEPLPAPVEEPLPAPVEEPEELSDSANSAGSDDNPSRVQDDADADAAEIEANLDKVEQLLKEGKADEALALLKKNAAKLNGEPEDAPAE